MESVDASLVCTDQVPSPLSVPSLILQPDGTPETSQCNRAQIICRICQTQINGFAGHTGGGEICSTEAGRSELLPPNPQECRY